MYDVLTHIQLFSRYVLLSQQGVQMLRAKTKTQLLTEVSALTR